VLDTFSRSSKIRDRKYKTANMFKLWSDLFKGAEPSATHASNLDIADDWINVEGSLDTIEVQNLNEHEVLSEETKERRRKWAKRLLKGRPQHHSGLPSKAQLKQRRRTSSAAPAASSSQTTSRPSTSADSDHQSQLRAKLKIATQHATALNSESNTPTPAASSSLNVRNAKSKRAACKNPYATRKSPKSMRVIQQPANRGIN